ncbi:MAG: chemotaxis protein CheR [Deltaproteobacteria bacterium CG_4_9_14_3_um_filter_63_12]|nr:MAG: chemotaxis protein CheR [Deltaproteobacteria bacterium CG_4_9_14_3_um_filter_63_12]
MNRAEREHIEIDLLLEAVFRRYGYDFRSYARASIERRTRVFQHTSGCATIAEMIPKVLYDEGFFSQLAQTLSVTVTEMFRDPFFYLSFRENVVPLLKTWPHFKVWHAGCATGEEVYSLAIVLKEEGLLERATLYATDFNDRSLSIAKEGIYDLDSLRKATESYQLAGGKKSFSLYYHAQYDAAAMDAELKKRLTFSNHNLASDHVFGDMQLILCRNVLIYFNRELQNRALGLFTESLVHGGFLCLGSKEELQFSSVRDEYVKLDPKAKIYKRTATP